MAQTQGYSKQQQEEAERLVALAERWARGYDRKRGVQFNIFASRTTAGVFYYTRFDGKPGACTCPGARNSKSGQCFHLLACRIATAQARERAARRPADDEVYDLVDAF